MTDITPTARAAREAARINGQFGEQQHSAPEVLLTVEERREARKARRAEVRRKALGDIPHADAIASILGRPVKYPATVAGHEIVGEGLTIDRVVDSPLDGYRAVVFADGSSDVVRERDIVRDLPAIPRFGEGRVEAVPATTLQPGDVVHISNDDTSKTRRQVLTVNSYQSIADGFARRIDVVFTDAPDRTVTYQNVDVEIIAS